jgi:hypothetical protein
MVVLTLVVLDARIPPAARPPRPIAGHGEITTALAHKKQRLFQERMAAQG